MDGPLVLVKAQLSASSQTPLHVCGMFHGKLQRKSNKTSQDVYVVCGLQKAFLGKPAIEALVVVNSSWAYCERGYWQKVLWPTREATRQLQNQAQRWSICTHTSKESGCAEREMEDQGIKSRIDEPTERYAEMVLLLKSNGKISMCRPHQKYVPKMSHHSICWARHSPDYLSKRVHQARCKFGLLADWARKGVCHIHWMALCQ